MTWIRRLIARLWRHSDRCSCGRSLIEHRVTDSCLPSTPMKPMTDDQHAEFLRHLQKRYGAPGRPAGAWKLSYLHLPSGPSDEIDFKP